MGRGSFANNCFRKLSTGAAVNYTPVPGLKRGEGTVYLQFCYDVADTRFGSERQKLNINVGQNIHNFTVMEVQLY